MTSGIPMEILEKRAADQRRQIHNSVAELRQTVRERFDIKRNLHQHLWPALGAAVLMGWMLGYSVTGIFTRN